MVMGSFLVATSTTDGLEIGATKFAPKGAHSKALEVALVCVSSFVNKWLMDSLL